MAVSEKFSSRDCLESPDRHQTGATQADIEGRGDRIFALQASDLASLTPLQPSFQTVSRNCLVNPNGLYFGVPEVGKTEGTSALIAALRHLRHQKHAI